MDIEYMKRVRKQTNIATVLYLIPHLEKLTQYVMEPDMIPGTQMINLDKRRKIANILNEISMYQKKAYDLVCHFFNQQLFFILFISKFEFFFF